MEAVRGQITPSAVVRFGSFELNLGSRELRKQGFRVKLQDQPFAVLSLLLERPGEVVPREVIRQKIWPADTFVDFDVGVNNAVKKIRQALGDSAEGPRFVETVPRHGYRFIAPVDSVDDSARIATPLSTELTALTAPRRNHQLPWPAIAIVAVAIVGVTAFAVVKSLTRDVVLLPQASIAVLPFENLSAQQSDDYFADAMTDAIITELAQFNGLRVISRTSALQYRRTTKSAPQIAGELRVGTILEGSVIRTGASVRIDAQLVDGRDDRHLWAQSYERDLRDILAVQREVANAVVTQIAAQLRPSSRPAVGAVHEVNPEAYEAYLKGRYYLLVPHGVNASAETTQSAVRNFQQALRIDPNYGPAYAGLADAYFQLGFAYFVHTLSPAESMRLSEAAAQKAISIDSSLADAHLVLGRIRVAQWRWAEGEQESRRAMELDPSNSSAYHDYSNNLVAAGRATEGVAVIRRALDHDPFSVDLNADLAWQLLDAREYQAALQQGLRVVALNPENPRYRLFALIYEGQGDYTRAVESYRNLAELFSDPNANANAHAELARAYARAGQRAEAERLLKEVAALSRPDTAYLLALGYGALGARDTAIRYLQKAFEERSGWLTRIRIAPELDPLRDDPRFNQIVHRMGLDAVH